MPIPRLRIDDAALLVVDMQERLLPTIADADRVIGNCAIMLRLAAELGFPYLVTEHCPGNLGRTVEPIQEAMVDRSARIEKARFSAAIDLVRDRLRVWQRASVLICGIEGHVCVLQSVLDLQGAGRQCFVVSDAVGCSQPGQVSHALRRMETAGAIITGVMSSLYELLGDARHPSLRACIELAKQVRQ
jgi:nicotinamidase-related amidase